MELGTVLDSVGLREFEEPFAANWAESQAAMPAGEIPFLAPQFVRWACGEAFLPEEVTEDLLRIARRVATDGPLRSVAWFCHHSLFVAAHKAQIPKWPSVIPPLEKDTGGFYVLALLSGTPQMQQVHRERAIPADVAKATILDLKLCGFTEDHFHEHGCFGISPRILDWLLNHWRGDLYRLGRLQFLPGKFGGTLRAYRQRETGVVVALCEPGLSFRRDGQVNGAGGAFDPDPWVSALDVTEGEIAGCPIDPRGFAVNERLRLRTTDWRQVLAPGDPALEMHIAAGEPMAFDACGESIRRALEFFPKHFPDRPFVALVCSSWILDPQFERLLPPTSNLARFQQEVYLFPLGGDGKTTLRTVFGYHFKDIQSAPRETTMQRAFARHVENGGHFHAAGCFLMREDVAWGKRVYRAQHLPFGGSRHARQTDA